MDKKWEIRRVSTSERIFNKIKEGVAQPVGIVLFGVDSVFKNEVLDAMVESCEGLQTTILSKVPSTDTLVWAFSSHSAVVVMLNSDESSTYDLRHELVKVMRNTGAETVVGIYAKVKPYSPKALIRLSHANAVNKQIAMIERSNPTADGLDYFIVVEEE